MEEESKTFVLTGIDPAALSTLGNQSREFQVKAMLYISEGLG